MMHHMNNNATCLKYTNEAATVFGVVDVSSHAIDASACAAAPRLATLATVAASKSGARHSRLPPTRAAHQSRSRGHFLRQSNIVVLALVAAFAILVAGAYPSLSRNLTFGNPGPALIAAASVPPSFVFPAKSL